MISWHRVTTWCTCCMFPILLSFLALLILLWKLLQPLSREHDSELLCAPLACLPYRFIAEEVARSRSAVRSVLYVLFLFCLCCTGCLLSHSDLIQAPDPPLGSVFWVTEEMWLKPVKRGSEVAAARTTVWHPVCDGVPQLLCAVSGVNQMKQIEKEFFFVCFLSADMSRCSRLLTPVGLFCRTIVSLIVSLVG